MDSSRATKVNQLYSSKPTGGTSMSMFKSHKALTMPAAPNSSKVRRWCPLMLAPTTAPRASKLVVSRAMVSTCSTSTCQNARSC